MGKDKIDTKESRLRDIDIMEEKLKKAMVIEERKQKAATDERKRKAQEAFNNFRFSPSNSGLYGSDDTSYKHLKDDRYRYKE